MLGGIIGTYQFRGGSSNFAFTSGRDCFFEAVNNHQLTRQTLVEKLLNNADRPEVRSGFANEIRQFLYIGHVAEHLDTAENKACKTLLKNKIKVLFKELSSTEARLKDVTIAVRSTLGESTTAGLIPKELLELIRLHDTDLAAQFKKAHDAVLKIETQIFEYCCDKDVFESYVKQYFQVASGYIPFTRTLRGEQVDTTIDVINRLFNLNIQVFVENSGGELHPANKTTTGPAIPIYHNGTNHFIGFEPKTGISTSNSALPQTNLLLFSSGATSTTKQARSLTLSSSPTTEFSSAMVPVTKTASTYRMSHLLAAGYRGIEYQLLVLLSELTTLLAKGPEYDFEATVENYDSGNLDDVVIVIKENSRLHALKAHQVKYYNHPISVYDFFGKEAQGNDKTSGKTEKMHIGKFLDGWLTWLKRYPTLEDKKRKSIIYTNADLDPILQRCVVNGEFNPQFVQGNRVICVGRNDAVKGFLNKNFLTHLKGQKVTAHYSSKVWGFLLSKGYLDKEGYFSDEFTPNGPGFQLNIPQKFLPKNVTPQVVLETLEAHYKALTDNQTDLFELLYKEAWQYLMDKNRHSAETKQSDKEKRILYRRFLSSFRFQTNQDDLATLEKNIQTDLMQVEGSATDEVFLCLYYELHAWFRKEYKGEVPILTRETVSQLIKEALIRSRDLADLQFRSRAVIDRLSYECEGQTVERPESLLLLNALGQPGFIKVIGRKGLGKSGLVKQGLVKCNPREYLIISAMDIVSSKELRTTLLRVLEKVEAIHIVVIDSAEALLQMPSDEFQALLVPLRKRNRTLILTLTPEGSQHEAFQKQCTEISLKPLLQKEVTKTFPQLMRYRSVQPLMALTKIPFYLSQIMDLINKMGAQQFDFIVKARAKVLEAELIKLVVEGQEDNMVLPRRLSWLQLAVTIARSRSLPNQGVALSSVTPATERLVKEGIIHKNNEEYLFDHDLFFEHGLMAFWFQKWETAFIEGKTPAFWRKLSQLLTTQRSAKAILENWLVLHIDDLKENLLVNIETLSQTTYLDLVFSTALITKQEQLFNAVLGSKKLPMNNVVRGIAGSHSTTYVLLTLQHDYPLGLNKLLINGTSAHHPNAGRLMVNGTSATYEQPKPVTLVIEDSARSSDNDEENHSSSESEEEEGYPYYHSYSSDSERGEPVLESSLEDEESDFIQDFCSFPTKYWSADFNKKPEILDEYDELSFSPPYKHELVYTTLYIHQAVLQDRVECLEVLFAHHERQKEHYMLNLRSNYQETPLHVGALNNAYASVKLLLQKGAYVDIQDHWDETPLHNAAYAGNRTLAKLLLENGANPNTLNDHDLSPLHVALAKLDFPMTELLLAHGADLTLNPFDSHMRDMVVADLLQEIFEESKENEEKVEEFALELIGFLNYGYDDNHCKWGSQCRKLDSEQRSLQVKQVDDLMTLVEGRAQLSEDFAGFDYYNSETELEYATENGDCEKIEILQDYILEDPDRIDDVLSSEALAHMKTELLDTWFETASQGQYNTLKDYAELYKDADVLARIMEDMSIMAQCEESSSDETTLPSNKIQSKPRSSYKVAKT